MTTPQHLLTMIFFSPFSTKLYSGNLVIGISVHMPQVLIISNEFQNENKTNAQTIRNWSMFNEINFKNDFPKNWDDVITVEQQKKKQKKQTNKTQKKKIDK